jgi:hypothetical protein
LCAITPVFRRQGTSFTADVGAVYVARTPDVISISWSKCSTTRRPADSPQVSPTCLKRLSEDRRRSKERRAQIAAALTFARVSAWIETAPAEAPCVRDP